jgi:hypothetical protein
VITTYRLVHRIEEDAAEMASAFVDQIERDPQAGGYLDHVPGPELWKRVHEIYRHLGEWMSTRTAGDVERRYCEIGVRRAQQGLPLSKLLYVILATKGFLEEYVRTHRPPLQQPSEVLADLEMEHLLDQFYNHAIVSAAYGYEQSVQQKKCCGNGGGGGCKEGQE